MPKYNHQGIEGKWRKKWEEQDLYKTEDDFTRPKYYILDMFPYPSGAGLHVGHPKGYIATDIFARKKMLSGYNVLHPMGWDAFGLPAENFALKNKIHPRIMTEKNVATYKSQLEKLGLTYDWSREINTTDPEFYKWTQWIFIKMFERGLAYESHEPIIWCPSCQTGLANEDLEDGKCERCGSEIERKPMRQWVLKITDYAERMLNDLEKLPDWEESIKEMQKNWIGKSDGARVQFSIINSQLSISASAEPLGEDSAGSRGTLEVFTTRPDTLFGCTYMVVAPEHEIIKNYKLKIKNYAEVEEYIDKAKNKSELERTDLNKEKTGVKIEGIAAVNPVNNEELPIFVADYVMMGYGTGAIMAVPAHDERDWEFAKKYDVQIKQVVAPDIEASAESLVEDSAGSRVNRAKRQSPLKGDSDEAFDVFTNDGININSSFLDGLPTKDAKEKMIAWLEEKGVGERAVNYKLKDWVFSRQRYWGEPIPIIHCEQCGQVAVPESELPLTLPEVENYEPSGTGESPLANITEWVNTTCPRCGGPARRETNTMPQWAGSSWYYLRYIDPHNNKALVDKEKDKYWSPVDFYVGGAEHATRHLIYARFWHKFLYDIGAVNYEEPFTRLQHVGLIIGEDGRKMSKRWGNVINPDEIIEKYGADAMRVYEMFMAPFSQSCAWSTNGLIGARKFLDRVYQYSDKLSDALSGREILTLLHKTIKKVGEDIDAFKFNTAVSQMMILSNAFAGMAEINRTDYEKFLIILAPFAPHLTEELWEKLGHSQSIFKEKWPEYNLDLIKEKFVLIAASINGKVRDEITVPSGASEDEARRAAEASEKIKKWLQGKTIEKIFYVPDKLINFVVK